MTTWMLFFMLVAGGADLAATEYGISNGYAHELNPLMQNRGVRIAKAIGIPVAAYLLTRQKPRAAKWVCIIHVGLYSATTVWNVRVIVSWGG